ncbi:hypothetical protein [Acidaminococcus timonensis]|uniref:hypothetical protein n=1 Tax=Acidaminococcus timonensis TaxID=1871002 RepID=UPI003A5B98D4
MENAQIAFYRKIKNGPSKQCASKVHISSDFQCLGCGKFFYQYGNGHFQNPAVVDTMQRKQKKMHPVGCNKNHFSSNNDFFLCSVNVFSLVLL